MKSDFSFLLAGLAGASAVPAGLVSGNDSRSGDSSAFAEMLKQKLSESSEAPGMTFIRPSAQLDLNPLNMAAETRFKAPVREKTETLNSGVTENRSTKPAEKQSETRTDKNCEDSNNETGKVDRSAVDSHDRISEDEADEPTEVAAETGLVDLQALNQLTALIAAEISEAVSPEDLEKIMAVIEQMPADKLQEMLGSEEGLKNVLIEMAAELESESSKEQLLSLIESPELAAMLKQATTEVSETAVADASFSQVTQTETLEQSKGSAKDSFKHSTEQALPEHAELPVEKADETVKASEQKEVLKSGDEKPAKHEEVKADASKPEASVKPEESIREEFRRLNESSESAEPNEGESESSLTASSGNVVNASAEPVSDATKFKSTIEEIAAKFMDFTEERAATGKAEKSAPAGAVNGHEGMKRTSAGEGSQNNGNMGNGFSSGSGNSGMSAGNARNSTAAHVPNTAFSEMLQKAEYLKTENGSKILNLELEKEQLGKVEMELSSRDGTVSAKISAESTMAKAKLDELIPQIREQLTNQGVNLGEITVDVSSKNPDERNSNQMSGRKNKSSRISGNRTESAEAIIRKNILPNLRRAALNIKAVDLTV